MAQDQGTYPGLCLLTDSDGKVITIEDSVSHDTVVFTHTNTGEGEFAICYPEVLGSGVPEAALANFGTHNVENTATQGYAFTLGDEEYLVRQNVIAPTPGEINDVLYSRSLHVDVYTMNVLVTKDGNVVKYLDGNDDNVCFVKYNGGEWHAEKDYYDQIIEASGLDPVSIGCTVADGVYNIKYGFNTYVMTEDSLTPEVAEWVDTVLGSFYSRCFNTGLSAWGKALALVKRKSGNACAGVTLKNFVISGTTVEEAVCPIWINTNSIAANSVPVGGMKLLVGYAQRQGMSALLYDDSDFEEEILGLTDTSIVSLAEIDMEGATVTADIDLPAGVTVNMPTFLPNTIIVGTLDTLPANLNAFEFAGNVNVEDFIGITLLTIGNDAAQFSNGNVVKIPGADVIGTYEVGSNNYIAITSSESLTVSAINVSLT